METGLSATWMTIKFMNRHNHFDAPLLPAPRARKRYFKFDATKSKPRGEGHFIARPDDPHLVCWFQHEQSLHERRVAQKVSAEKVESQNWKFKQPTARAGKNH
jgi:hypothetical protein